MKNIKEIIGKLRNKAMTIVKEHGLGFLTYAIFVNILDEVFIPAILAYFGFSVLGGLMILGDLDWLTYPLYFLFSGTFRGK